MSGIEIAALIVAVAFAALVGFLVPVLLQARKAVAEAEQSLVRINTELLPLLNEMRTTLANLNELVEKTRDGVDHASVLLHTAGEIGESVQQFHDMVRGTGGSLLRNVVNMVFAGIQAATAAFGGRARGRGNGG
jgi:uncharacterized protein YoxC